MVRFDKFENWSMRDVVRTMDVIKYLHLLLVLIMSVLLFIQFFIITNVDKYAYHFIIAYISMTTLSILLNRISKQLYQSIKPKMVDDFLKEVVTDFNNAIERINNMSFFEYIKFYSLSSSGWDPKTLEEMRKRIETEKEKIKNVKDTRR